AHTLRRSRDESRSAAWAVRTALRFVRPSHWSCAGAAHRGTTRVGPLGAARRRADRRSRLPTRRAREASAATTTADADVPPHVPPLRAAAPPPTHSATRLAGGGRDGERRWRRGAERAPRDRR